MDPTAALTQLRELIEMLDAGEVHPRAIVDAFKGLDDWLSRGGFLPDQWSENRKVN